MSKLLKSFVKTKLFIFILYFFHEFSMWAKDFINDLGRGSLLIRHSFFVFRLSFLIRHSYFVFRCSLLIRHSFFVFRLSSFVYYYKSYLSYAKQTFAIRTDNEQRKTTHYPFAFTPVTTKIQAMKNMAI